MAAKKTRSVTEALFAEFMKNKEISGLVLHGDGLLGRDTLLVHFTSVAAAEAIARDGFRFGVPNTADLGMTKGRQAFEPGFNFAFVADDYPDYWSETFSRQFAVGGGPERDGRFGVVMFRAQAVHTYHWDDMWQAVFWGPEVAPAQILAFAATEDFEQFDVEALGPSAFSGTLPDALAWADKKIPRAGQKPVSLLPWPDLTHHFNAANLADGLNPYCPLAPKLDQVVDRCGLETRLRQRGLIGERLTNNRPGDHTVRWAATDLADQEIAVSIDVHGVGAALALRPRGMGNRHPRAVIVGLPEDFDPDRLNGALNALDDHVEAALDAQQVESPAIRPGR